MSARDHALDLLLRAKLPGWSKLSVKRGPRGKLDSRDYALGESIAAVVTRNLLLLRHLIKHYSGREIARIDPLVQVILSIGLAQLRFFTRIPASAAVDEAVEQAKRLKLGRASGFINAVLRSAVREPVAPLPSDDDAENFARVVLSHPIELYRKLVDVVGPTKALKLAERHNAEAPTILRLAKGTNNALLRAAIRNVTDAPAAVSPAPLAAEGVDQAEREGASPVDEPAPSQHEHASLLSNPSPYPLPSGAGEQNGADAATTEPVAAPKGKPARVVILKPHEVSGFLVVEGAVESDFAKWSAAGLAQVQDPTSAAVVGKLDVTKGLRVLDRCCGVGTKTIQIAEKVGPDGVVVAVDPNKTRIERLQRLLAERGLAQVKPIVGGMMADLGDTQPFDRILIDVPCSNSGVLMRRPEARYRQDAKSLKSLNDLQRRILLDTVPHLAAAGLLVYSTCSIWPEENGEQIQWLLQQTDTLEVVSLETTLPALSPDADRHHDGGFTAVLRRKA